MTEEMITSQTGEVGQPRTIETITAEIVMIKRTAAQVALYIAIELGRRLVEAKELLAHGEWGSWLEKSVQFSQDTAGRYMKLFREYGNDQTSLFGAEVKSATLRNLSVSKALALLAVPAEEREAFAREHHVEDLSTRQMEELKKQVQDAADAKEAAEAALAGERLEKEKTANERDDLARRVKELEARPVEIAVQEPDPEELKARVDAAVKEASKTLRAEAKDLRAQLKEARAKAEGLAKEAEENKKAAAAAGEKLLGQDAMLETERALREQIKVLEKKLTMSDAAVTALNVYFESIQREFAQLTAGLAAIGNEQLREKLRCAVLELLDKLRREIEKCNGD